MSNGGGFAAATTAATWRSASDPRGDLPARTPPFAAPTFASYFCCQCTFPDGFASDTSFAGGDTVAAIRGTTRKMGDPAALVLLIILGSLATGLLWLNRGTRR